MDNSEQRLPADRMVEMDWTKVKIISRPADWPPEIVSATPFPDFTIIVTFDNGIIKKYDMKKMFDDPRIGWIYDSIKVNSEDFVQKFTFAPDGVQWDDLADLSEHELWNNGEII